MMDKLIIKESRFNCNIGITEEERKIKQEIILDAELFFDIKKSAQTGDIKHTVDYLKVHSLMKDITEKKEYNLIETLAEDTASSILEKFPIEKITLKVMKPNSLAKFNVKYSAVEITRAKNG